MSDINLLIDFINSDPKTHRSWSSRLDENFPSWEKMFAVPQNWDLLERTNPQNSYKDLCWLILHLAGFELANRWIKSENKDQLETAKSWFLQNLQYWPQFDKTMKFLAAKHFTNLLEILNVEIWRDLTDEMKLIFVTELFKEEDRGEPFNFISEHNYQLGQMFDLLRPSMYRERNHLEMQQLFDENHWLIPLSIPIILNYYPSISVVKTRIVAEDAGDHKWVQRIDKMIADRENACKDNKINDYYEIILDLFKKGKRKSKSKILQRTVYKQSGESKYQTNELLNIVAKFDFSPGEMPQIYHSNETPPLFVDYPEMEDIDKNGEFKNHDFERTDTISIEELLGCYVPNQRQIIIYDRGIEWCAKRNGFDKNSLENVVIIHELAHWITHLVPGVTTRNWDLDLFNRTETNVHEGFAQLLTWWVAEKVGKEFKDTFEKLNRNQSSAYHVFEQFKSEHKHSILISLEDLRKLSAPATLQDWKNALLLKVWS